MRKGERTRRDILDTAARLFFEQGYSATAIQDILDALRISKGSFYHHFDTKFDVLAQLASQKAQEAWAAYERTRPFQQVQALNSLLYHASLLQADKLLLTKSLADLKDGFEGAALLKAMQSAVLALFYSPFVQLMEDLRQQDAASFQDQSSLRLAFQGFLSGTSLLILHTNAQSDGLSLLRALRRQLESNLGLKAGSLVIIENTQLNMILEQL